jgi:hypothetical protein
MKKTEAVMSLAHSSCISRFIFIQITKVGTSNIISSICEQYKLAVIILVSNHALVVTSGVTE